MVRLGLRVALRLRPVDVTVLHNDNRRLTTSEEHVLGAMYRSLNQLLGASDVVSIYAALTPATDRLFSREKIGRMKRGACGVNAARGRIVDTRDLTEALRFGQLAGSAGDVWYPQPAPPNHPWREMHHPAMTRHVSGTALEAQRR
jgi:formate dehydrogenase